MKLGERPVAKEVCKLLDKLMQKCLALEEQIKQVLNDEGWQEIGRGGRRADS